MKLILIVNEKSFNLLVISWFLIQARG